MIIPASSAIVINGVNYASLILGVSLGNSGIKVLIADKGDSLHNEQDLLLIDDYSKAFLQAIGFSISDDFCLRDLFNQSKRMLANQLCSILWETQIGKTSDKSATIAVWLKSPKGMIEHETRFVVDSNDLFITDINSTIRHIAFYYWKLEGVLNDYINPSILLHQQKEKSILEEFYSEKTSLPDKVKILFSRKKQSVLHIHESKLSLHLSQDRAIEAGDLLPNLKVYDEKKQQTTSFFEWCKPGMFCMIMMGQLSQENLFNIAKWLKGNFPLYLFYLPPTEKNEHIFKSFHIIEGEKKALIIRPDRYIGFINDKIDLEIIDNYLTNILFFETKSKPINQKLLGSPSIENYP